MGAERFDAGGAELFAGVCVGQMKLNAVAVACMDEEADRVVARIRREQRDERVEPRAVGVRIIGFVEDEPQRRGVPCCLVLCCPGFWRRSVVGRRGGRAGQGEPCPCIRRCAVRLRGSVLRCAAPVRATAFALDVGDRDTCGAAYGRGEP